MSAAVDKIEKLFYSLIMEVTTTIPDELIDEVRNYSDGKDITASLIAALTEWLSFRKIKELNNKIETEPFEFSPGFSSEAVRSLNRR